MEVMARDVALIRDFNSVIMSGYNIKTTITSY